MDSGADIACSLSRSSDIDVVCPTNGPNPKEQVGWSFPDTEEGVIQAVEKGATHLWANTILFSTHPLQVSAHLARFQDHVKIVGQSPLIAEKYDDKEFVNGFLRKLGGFTMPRSWTVRESPDNKRMFQEFDLPFPIVAKPIRGRGSHGVRVCRDLQDLTKHAQYLFKESSAILLEEYLSGEEATVTVMPLVSGKGGYWALPVVTRFNHVDGVAPYNGAVAVTENSRAITAAESNEPTYKQVAEECERAAQELAVTAPIRIDVRRFKDSADSKFALFDVNMKPVCLILPGMIDNKWLTFSSFFLFCLQNMTGPGRPGREDQASLTLLAAEALGWDYQELLRRILSTCSTLRTLRDLKPRQLT
ncbi:hypothetical protein ACHAPI_005296 [Fusarium lateritium]